jgi:hypothetical protein
VIVATAVGATLPHGLWVEGERRVDAELRPLTGADEEFLLGPGSSLLPAERTTALLARCLVQLGGETPASMESVRSLAVGDREALLLQLRAATLGDRLDCVVICPACGEVMDVRLAVTELVLEPYSDAPERREAVLDGRPVAYRAVTGADQEAGARMALVDVDAAARLVLERCLEAADGDELTPEVERTLPALLAEADPQAELALRLRCTGCESEFSVALDAGTFLARELAGRQDELYRQVHVLASHYHWSEAELLALTPAKRRLYLELVADAAGSGA